MPCSCQPLHMRPSCYQPQFSNASHGVQLRMVHVASGTVFQNWPTSQTTLGHVHSLCFSPQGGFLAIGNFQGHVLLYRMMHYESL